MFPTVPPCAEDATFALCGFAYRTVARVSVLLQVSEAVAQQEACMRHIA